jgi:hypothetical protein
VSAVFRALELDQDQIRFAVETGQIDSPLALIPITELFSDDQSVSVYDIDVSLQEPLQIRSFRDRLAPKGGFVQLSDCSLREFVERQDSSSSESSELPDYYQ